MNRPDARPEGVRQDRAEAIDPDVDLHVPAQRAETGGSARWLLLGACSAGGAIGAAARYGATLWWPSTPGDFPWSVLWVNVTGCALIGVLMVLVSEGGRTAHHLVRPFLGVGVLGGFTTFSTYAVGFSALLDRGEPATALGYAAATLLGALAAVWAGAALTRALLAGRTGDR
ncbi:CrcB family protein [Streptomyces sp. NPDC006879]|uniref:FluC/FEX family fluoride channel n=1 Tax=Streptomyces sp. NPDC006879 TaxID=3364767 RepID=UPI0036A4FB62